MRETTPTQETSIMQEWDYRVAYACVEYRCSELDKDTFVVANLVTYYCVIRDRFIPSVSRRISIKTLTQPRKELQASMLHLMCLTAS